MSERNRIYGMVYNTNEKGWKYRTGEWAVMVTVFGHFLGKTLKGWWRLGPWKDMERFEVQVSVGGEDNMIQFGGAVPGQAAAHAKAGQANAATGDIVVRQQIIDGRLDDGEGDGPFQGHRLFAGVIRFGGDVAIVEIGGEGDITSGGEPIGDVFDVVVQAPPFL